MSVAAAAGAGGAALIRLAEPRVFRIGDQGSSVSRIMMAHGDRMNVDRFRSEFLSQSQLRDGAGDGLNS
ncbi:MAG: hypothetical protein ACJ8HJ_02575 [Massilia sp.]